MKIVFLCGSLKPGCDGVGDYTRRLAGELISIGHKAGIIALNDQYTTEEINSGQQSNDFEIPVLRLPAQWPSKKRFERAGIWIDDFNPEWLSIQFVPFSFHPKGLSFGLSKLLEKLGSGRRWHIMVHELWVGMDKEASLKFVFWGWLQKKLIKSLFTNLNPDIVHTQSSLYKRMLGKIGFSAELLPLFGNIPVVPNMHIRGANEINNISFVIFGGIHPGAPIKDFISEIKLYSISTGKKIELKMLGRCGKEQFEWENECKENGLSVQILGEQSPQIISHVLSNSSFGISTTPFYLIEKSGSFAAMREHDLQVLCVSRAWHPRGITAFNIPAGITQYKSGIIEEFIKNNSRSQSSNGIDDIANQFVNNLLAIT